MRGQVWLETVIYTLVGLALIALVLGIVTPRINDYRERGIIDQSIDVLNRIDSVLEGISSSPGNARVVEVSINKGLMVVDSSSEMISFVFEDSVLYSEESVLTSIGRVQVLTETGNDGNRVSLFLNESYFDISSDEAVKEFQPASVPYRFRFENRGLNSTSGKIEIEFSAI